MKKLNVFNPQRFRESIKMKKLEVCSGQLNDPCFVINGGGISSV